MNKKFLDWVDEQGYGNLSNSYRNLMYAAYKAGCRSMYDDEEKFIMHINSARALKKPLDYALENAPENFFNNQNLTDISIFNSGLIMRGTCQDCKHWDRDNQTEGSAQCTSARSLDRNTNTFALYTCNCFEKK